MKKIFLKVPILIITMLFFMSCGNKVDASQNITQNTNKVENKKKILLVYYSFGGTIDKVVEKIQQKIDVDTLKVEMVNEMSEQQLRSEVPRLLEDKYRPEIKYNNVDLLKYDLIIIGTPTWYSDVALPLQTYLDKNDLSGKEVVAFATHGGGPGDILNKFESYMKGSKVKKGILFRKSDVMNDRIDTELDKWLETLK